MSNLWHSSYLSCFKRKAALPCLVQEWHVVIKYHTNFDCLTVVYVHFVRTAPCSSHRVPLDTFQRLVVRVCLPSTNSPRMSELPNATISDMYLFIRLEASLLLTKLAWLMKHYTFTETILSTKKFHSSFCTVIQLWIILLAAKWWEYSYHGHTSEWMHIRYAFIRSIQMVEVRSYKLANQ